MAFAKSWRAATLCARRSATYLGHVNFIVARSLCRSISKRFHSKIQVANARRTAQRAEDHASGQNAHSKQRRTHRQNNSLVGQSIGKTQTIQNKLRQTDHCELFSCGLSRKVTIFRAVARRDLLGNIQRKRCYVDQEISVDKETSISTFVRSTIKR